MDKKQMGIIVVLLVLIVCAGVLATKLNSPFYVNGSDTSGKNAVSTTDNTAKTTTTSIFSEVRLSRDHSITQVLQQLQTIIDDKNVSKESKDNASNQYAAMVVQKNNSTKIESLLKMKGYTDTVCTIEDDKVVVTVLVKALTDKQSKEIQSTVMDVTKMNNVEINAKQ
ncbi:MAG TPA: SpoIIIAH-like family protein [Clostridiaceae bacterium]